MNMRKTTGQIISRQDAEKAERKKAFFCLLFAFAFFTVLGFYVDRYIHIKALYTDDLYTWSCYGEQNFWEFAFPFRTSSRFRPVYWTATFLEMMIIRTHISWFVPVNIILNAGIALTLYIMAKRLSRSFPAALLTGSLFLISRFAYYQIGQALGLLETMAQWMALMVLWFLYSFINARKQPFRKPDANASVSSDLMSRSRTAAAGRQGVRWFYYACIMYFILAFTHERYVGLLPLFYLALLFTETAPGIRKWKLWLLPAADFAVIFLIRRIMIGQALPAGTGGTEVTDTFHLGQALSFAVNQVQYIFGVNIGPSYLSGITWKDCAPYIHYLVYASWLPLAAVAVTFVTVSVRKALISRQWTGSNLLFLMFIALCIGCSSVTIRVEMRWVYVSYSASLLYLSYMLGVIRRALGSKAGRWIAAAAFGLYFLLMAPVEKYYRTYYSQIYFWEDQDRMNSLYDETIGKYGTDGVLGKQVYIIGNTYKMTDFYARTFFKVFDPAKTGQGTRISFAETKADLPAAADAQNSIVLMEVPEARGYQDVTEEVLGK